MTQLPKRFHAAPFVLRAAGAFSDRHRLQLRDDLRNSGGAMTRPVIWVNNTALIMFWVALAFPTAALELPAPEEQPEHRMDRFSLRTPEQNHETENSNWHYGGFADLGYSLDVNLPANHLFRGRSTTPRVNELDLNMGGAFVRKDATEQSRWGTELMGHGGQNAKDFGFAVNEPKVGSSDQLRHSGRANLS